jgi:hypothetical protein
MSPRIFELAVRARRFVARSTNPSHAPRGQRFTARRQLGEGGGGELTQFSFRLALVIDLAYVGIGALGGAAVGRASVTGVPVADRTSTTCSADSVARVGRGVSPPNAERPAIDTVYRSTIADPIPRLIR